MGSDPFQSHGDRWTAGHNLLLIDIPASGGDEFCFVEPTTFNVAYWQGYRTPSNPATYTLRMGQQDHNSCNLENPPALVNEPFAASPTNSSVSFGLVNRSGKKRFRELTVTLLDDSAPAHAMVGRTLRVWSVTGRALGAAVTDGTGQARVRMPGSVKTVQIDDITDNNLTFSAAAGSRVR
jgi:hypothetical protein